MLCSAQCLEVESSAAQLCAALRSSKPKDWSDTDGSGKLSRKELEASLGKIRPAMNALRPLFRNSFGHDPFSRECCGALPEITDEAHDVHDSCKDTVNSRSWKAWNHLDEASESIRFCVGYLWHRLFLCLLRGVCCFCSATFDPGLGRTAMVSSTSASSPPGPVHVWAWS